MSQSAILQQIASQYMRLAQTDLASLAVDMTYALPAHEMPIPGIKAVEKITLVADPGVTPHLSVYFTATNDAEYCWDMIVRMIEKHEFSSSKKKKTPFCYASLTLMRMPDEAARSVPGLSALEP